MKQADRTEDDEMNESQNSGSALVQSIFAGVLIGSLANIVALSFGHSIWIGLLCHSFFGAISMMLVLYVTFLRTESVPRKSSKAAVTTQPVRH